MGPAPASSIRALGTCTSPATRARRRSPSSRPTSTCHPEAPPGSTRPHPATAPSRKSQRRPPPGGPGARRVGAASATPTGLRAVSVTAPPAYALRQTASPGDCPTVQPAAGFLAHPQAPATATLVTIRDDAEDTNAQRPRRRKDIRRSYRPVYLPDPSGFLFGRVRAAPGPESNHSL